YYSFFRFSCHDDPPGLRSFPTRRSSDLGIEGPHGSGAWGSGAAEGPHGRVRAGDEDRSLVLDAPLDHVVRLDPERHPLLAGLPVDRKSTRLNSSHVSISYAVFCLKKKKL